MRVQWSGAPYGRPTLAARSPRPKLDRHWPVAMKLEAHFTEIGYDSFEKLAQKKMVMNMKEYVYHSQTDKKAIGAPAVYK